MNRLPRLLLAAALAFASIPAAWGDDCGGCAPLCRKESKKAACEKCRELCAETKSPPAAGGVVERLKSRLAEGRSELSALRERERVATSKCANIPADEPYPDQVRAECAGLKKKLAESIAEREKSLRVLEKVDAELATIETLRREIQATRAAVGKIVAK